MADTLMSRALNVLHQTDMRKLTADGAVAWAQAVATFTLANEVEELRRTVNVGFGGVMAPLDGIATTMNRPDR